MSKSIFDIIQYVHSSGSHKNQLKYDFPREKIYSLVALQVASLKPETVLDVGCAYGTLDVFLSECKMRVTALDIMPELHNAELFEKHGINFEKKNIEKETLSGKYDVILFTDVLEHLNYNPLQVMKKLRKVCNKGIVLTTPARETDYVCNGKWGNVISWRQIPDFSKYEFVDGHHHTYTRWELEDLLNESGFEVSYVKYLPMESTWLITARAI